MSRAAVTFGLLAMGLWQAGCGDPPNIPPPTYPVRGTVTVNSVPLKEGIISFVPEKLDGLSTEVGKIVDGSFETKARAGKLKVEIRSPRKLAETEIAGQPIPVLETIPAHYNSETTLTVEVSASEPNDFSFDLKK